MGYVCTVLTNKNYLLVRKESEFNNAMDIFTFQHAGPEDIRDAA